MVLFEPFDLNFPVVFVINGITKGDWLQAFLFAISIAVGLTPEMLPMIVTTCLAKGAVSMSKKKTIVKNLNSIQNFGAIDILCTDKTGTLTQDKVILSYFCKPQGISITEDLQNVRASEQVNNRVSLETLCLGKTRYSSVLPKQEYHWNTNGTEDTRILRHAYLNSYFQTGYKNVMDLAIIHKTEEEENSNPELLDFSENYEKVDEIPFDFTRRRLSVVVKDRSGKTQMVTKGAVEEMLSVCSFVEMDGEVRAIDEEVKQRILKTVDDFNNDGFRVLALAHKTNPSPALVYSCFSSFKIL